LKLHLKKVQETLKSDTESCVFTSQLPISAISISRCFPDGNGIREFFEVAGQQGVPQLESEGSFDRQRMY